MAQNGLHAQKERSEPSKNSRWLKTQNERQVAENSQNGRLQFVGKKSAPHPCSMADSHTEWHGTDKIKRQHKSKNKIHHPKWKAGLASTISHQTQPPGSQHST